MVPAFNHVEEDDFLDVSEDDNQVLVEQLYWLDFSLESWGEDDGFGA